MSHVQFKKSLLVFRVHLLSRRLLHLYIYIPRSVSWNTGSDNFHLVPLDRSERMRKKKFLDTVGYYYSYERARVKSLYWCSPGNNTRFSHDRHIRHLGPFSIVRKVSTKDTVHLWVSTTFADVHRITTPVMQFCPRIHKHNLWVTVVKPWRDCENPDPEVCIYIRPLTYVAYDTSPRNRKPESKCSAIRRLHVIPRHLNLLSRLNIYLNMRSVIWNLPYRYSSRLL